MSRQITQPVNQVRLTNVAVVRLSRGGHRFEVACYRNKIVNYRQGTETDLSEVLQTERIFTNVSKGQFANSKILKKCFGTTDEEEVCRFILANGDVQVSDQERAAQLESTAREVASMVSEKCVHPISRRPYTMPQIRDAMKAAGFMVHPTRNIKQQFLDCVRLLQEKQVLDIERAKMKLAIVLLQQGGDDSDNDSLKERRDAATAFLVNEGVAPADILPDTGDNDTRIIFQSDPALYRRMDGIARNDAVQGRLEIIQQCVTEEGDVTLGDELERKAQQQQQREEHVHTTGKLATTQSAAVDSNSHSEDVATLSEELQSGLRLTRNTDDTNEDDQDVADHHPTITKVSNSRKAQKAAQKKSKKAKRREKEEAAEREEKIAAEKARQKERDERRGIQRKSSDGDAAATSDNRGDQVSNGDMGDNKACTTCGGSFAPHEYRSHFRSDWHRYNIKLKMKGCAPVSEKEFLLCDSDAFF